MAIDLSIHTMVIHHIITRKEAEFLCKKFKVCFGKEVDIPYSILKISGIDNIHITANRIPNPNEAATSYNCKYDLSIRFNLGRLIKDSNHLMLIWNKKNSNSVRERLAEVLRNDFMLCPLNSNVMDWYITRIDCGMDIKVAANDGLTPDEYIYYLHKLFDERNPQDYRYVRFNGFNLEETKYESLCLINEKKGYTYNIYYKKAQLQNKCAKTGATLSAGELQEVEGVIRIEKQISDFNIIKRGNKKFEVLYDLDTTEKAMDTVIKDVDTLFGEDIFVMFADDYRREYDPQADPFATGFHSIVHRELYNRTKPRRKSAFGVPRLVKEDGRSPRYKAKISLHDTSGDTYPFTVTCRVGESLHDCERKVYEKIIENFNTNYNYSNWEQNYGIYECVLDELQSFLQTISLDNKELKKDVRDRIRYLEGLYSIKRELDKAQSLFDGEYVDFYGHKLRIGL